jgi:hypothetical protein
MGWRFVRQPNRKIARFSEVVDHFTHFEMTEEEAILLCIDEYEMGRKEAEKKVSRCDDVPERYPSRWVEAIASVRLQHGDQQAEEIITGGF